MIIKERDEWFDKIFKRFEEEKKFSEDFIDLLKYLVGK